MIAEFEDDDAPGHTATAYRIYGLRLAHKHLPEMQAHAGLARRPLFCPAVGRFAQGMIVEAPLALGAMPGTPTVRDVHICLQDAYDAGGKVLVADLQESAALETLEAEALAGRDDMRLHVFGAEAGEARLVALLDNLGKGAAGAAVQNLELMLGLGAPPGVITPT
jgi:N-acetyl-gamma-glutamyl-phosphate reductase